MEELLKKLLEAEVLNEETKAELEGAFKTKIDEAIADAKKDAEAQVRLELTEQWVKEREVLVEALDTKMTELLAEEIKELGVSVSEFRDLEAKYAEDLVEAKSAMAQELKGDIAALVEQLDTFLEIRIAAELDELSEDLQEARKNDFGRRIFEAVAEEFTTNFVEDDELGMNLREANEHISNLSSTLEETEAELDSLKRKIKMQELLAPLSGRQKDVMEAILASVETSMLEEGYKTFITRVLRESDEVVTSEKEEEKVLAEGKVEKSEEIKGVKVSGDSDTVITENVKTEEKAQGTPVVSLMRQLAGLK